MPLYVLPKTSSYTFRLAESAESCACNAAFTSYSALAVGGPKSKLPTSQMAAPPIFVHRRARAMFLSICRSKRPLGCEVQAARCFVQNKQPQARTGMFGLESGQTNAKRKFQQWQLPRIWRSAAG